MIDIYKQAVIDIKCIINLKYGQCLLTCKRAIARVLRATEVRALDVLLAIRDATSRTALSHLQTRFVHLLLAISSCGINDKTWTRHSHTHWPNKTKGFDFRSTRPLCLFSSSSPRLAANPTSRPLPRQTDRPSQPGPRPSSKAAAPTRNHEHALLPRLKRGERHGDQPAGPSKHHPCDPEPTRARRCVHEPQSVQLAGHWRPVQ